MKRVHALYVICMQIFVNLVLYIVLKQLFRSISIMKEEWDEDTVTASDYAAEIQIAPSTFDRFLKKKFPKDVSPIVSFHRMLEAHMTNVI